MHYSMFNNKPHTSFERIISAKMYNIIYLIGISVALSYIRNPVHAVVAEPRCSKFDFEEKLLEKLVKIEHKTEIKMKDLENKCNNLQGELAVVKEELKVKGKVAYFSTYSIHSICIRGAIKTARLFVGKARFTSALRQPCTCLRTHFWGISCGSLKTILRFARPQGCRNVVRRIFNMFIFLAFFGRCLEVARQLQGSLEMTARLTYEFTPSDT